MSESFDNYLEHYGVVGMKWGIRRTPEELGHRKTHSQKKTVAQKNREIKRDRRKAAKNRRVLSEDEIDKRIKRLEKEKKLKDLTGDDVSVGEKFVKDTFKKVGGAAAVGALAYGLKVFVEKAPQIKSGALGEVLKDINWKELATYVAPNPNKKK